MHLLTWDRYFQLAAPFYGLAVASFIGGWRFKEASKAMRWQNVLLFCVSIAAWIAAFVLTGLALWAGGVPALLSGWLHGIPRVASGGLLAVGVALLCFAPLPWVYRFYRRRALIPLSVELAIDSLGYAYPPKWPQLAIDSGLPKREFALMTVQNVGKRDAASIFAECKLATSGESLNCHWSKESNGKFVLGGSHEEGLKVWQKRVLLIAQVYSGKLSDGGQRWCCLPATASDIFPEPITGVPYLAAKNNEALRRSPAGEPLDLDHEVEVIVSLRADGVNHSERLMLSFNWKGPTIYRVPQEGHPKG